MRKRSGANSRSDLVGQIEWDHGDDDQVGEEQHRQTDFDVVHELVLRPADRHHILGRGERRGIRSGAGQRDDHADGVGADVDGLGDRHADGHEQHDRGDVRHELRQDRRGEEDDRRDHERRGIVAQHLKDQLGHGIASATVLEAGGDGRQRADEDHAVPVDGGHRLFDRHALRAQDDERSVPG